MKAQPSFQCHVKSEDKKVKFEDKKKIDWAKETIDLTKPQGVRRLERKEFSKHNIRGGDEVVFIDLPGTYDYDAYFKPCYDKKLNMHIKGPFSNLHWTFSAIDESREEGLTDRRVLTQSRPFQSAPGKFVPQFLPNYKSAWYKTFKRIDNTRLADNAESFEDEIESIICKSEVMKSCKEDDGSEWEILGLRAYKVPNTTVTTFNLLHQSPASIDQLRVAEFDNSGKTMLQIFGYASNVEKDDQRNVADKQEVKDWLKTIPPEPYVLKNGYSPGESTRWFNKLYGEGHPSVLERVLMKSKSPLLKRPDKAAYNDSSRTLKTDQDILDRLPQEEFFSTMSNSVNADQAIINRLANQAFGNQCDRSAKDLLKLLLEDDLEQERKRLEELANMTPEAIAAKEAQKKATNEKRKATRARNKAAKEAEAAAAAAAAAAGTTATATTTTTTTTTAALTEVEEDDDEEDDDDENDDNDDDDDVAEDASDRSGTDDEDEQLLETFFPPTKTTKHQAKRGKSIATKLANKARTEAIKRVQKELQQAKVKAAVKDPITQVSVLPTNPQLDRLVEANNKMLQGVYQRFNVNVDNRVAPDSLVIVKTGADDNVIRDSIAIILGEVKDPKNKRQLAYEVLLLDGLKQVLHTVTINCKDLYRVEERK